MKSHNKSRVRLCLVGMLSFSMLFSNLCSGNAATTVYAQAEISGDSAEETTIKFTSESAKPGDTVTVEGAPEDAVYEWELKSLSSAKDKRNGGWTSIYDEELTYETTFVQRGKGCSYSITDKTDECFLQCKVEDPDGNILKELSIYISKLPVMYINSETSYYGLNKNNYSKATMKLVGNEKYGACGVGYEGDMEIKTRGNSTNLRPKRPFKLKLATKTNLLGIDSDGVKSKHWVLLANDIDHTLLRNKLLYDFSGQIGTDTYFDSANITVIYNGNYEGVYQLCEHRRVDEGRIEIYDWVSAGEDAAKAIAKKEYKKAGYESKDLMQAALNEIMYQDYSWMDEESVTLSCPDGIDRYYQFDNYGIELPEQTGGFLTEMDFYSKGSSTVAGLTTSYGQPLYFSAPEAGADAKNVADAVLSFKNTKLYKYANTYTQTFEYALHSQDFTFSSGLKNRISSWEQTYNNENGWTNGIRQDVEYTDTERDGMHYSELFDMDSLVNNFICVEYAMNWDSMKNSFFYYKDIDSLAVIAPQWDFDWCWGNINMYNNTAVYEPKAWHTTIESFTREQSYQSYNWNRLLVKDPYFLVRVYEEYQSSRELMWNMIEENGTIDSYEAYLENAGLANDRRWSYTYSQDYSGARTENFSDSIKSMKDFISTRLEWMDEQFATVESLVNSIGYYKSAEDMKVFVDKKNSQSSSKIIVNATVGNEECKSIIFQLNGTEKYEARVENGMAAVEIALEDLIADGSTYNVITAYQCDTEGKYIDNTSLKPSGNFEYIPNSAFTYFVFEREAGEVEEPTPVVSPTAEPTAVATTEPTTVPTTKPSTVPTVVPIIMPTTTPTSTAVTTVEPAKTPAVALENSGLVLEAPVVSKIANTKDSICLEWKSVEDATFYTVYRKEANGDYLGIASVSAGNELRYEDKRTVNGRVYSYKVVAGKDNLRSEAAGEESIVRLSTVKISSLSWEGVSKNNLKVNFTKNAKASGYEIQYSSAKDSFKKNCKKLQVKSAKKTSASIKKLKAKKVYSVRIRAYKKLNGKIYYSAWSNSKTVSTK